MPRLYPPEFRQRAPGLVRSGRPVPGVATLLGIAVSWLVEQAPEYRSPPCCATRCRDFVKAGAFVMCRASGFANSDAPRAVGRGWCRRCAGKKSRSASANRLMNPGASIFRGAE